MIRVLLALFLIQSSSRIDSAFQKFWTDGNAGDVINAGVTFDDALKRLKAGRTYAAQKTGVIMLGNTTADGLQHFYAVNIPPNYDPRKRYQVRFQLHGGVMGRSSNQPRGNGDIGSLAGVEQIYVLPYAWDEAPWWSEDQLLNLNAILDSLKRTYNVDENRVVLSGVSDGGTGTFYVAMRNTTPFASFLPLNGFILVLDGGDLNDGNLPNNLVNKPLFVVNGGRDPLYPTSRTGPGIRHMMDYGVDISYHPQPGAAHNTAWWPDLRDTYEKFVAGHPRNPHPDKLTWETSDLAHNRAHWLVIDELGDRPGDAQFTFDVNDDPAAIIPDFAATTGTMFRWTKKPGRVDLERDGNTVHVRSRGVAAFTLLLSPDRFDFTKPVKVVVNGRTVFEGLVKKDLKTLMKWAAVDNDRTMLFGAELKIFC